MRSAIGCGLRPTVGSAVFAALMAMASLASAADGPKFRDYRVKVDQQPSVAPMLVGDAKTYAKALRAAKGQTPNFGGHYFLVTWGCGTRCAAGAVVDTRNGAVSFLPGYVTEWHEGDKPFWFQANSSLFVFSGHFDEDDAYSATYYVIEDGRFRLRASVPDVSAPAVADVSPAAGDSSVPEDTPATEQLAMPPRSAVSDTQTEESRIVPVDVSLGFERDADINKYWRCLHLGLKYTSHNVAVSSPDEQHYVMNIVSLGGFTTMGQRVTDACAPLAPTDQNIVKKQKIALRFFIIEVLTLDSRMLDHCISQQGTGWQFLRKVCASSKQRLETRLGWGEK